jgi:hypothetical protein
MALHEGVVNVTGVTLKHQVRDRMNLFRLRVPAWVWKPTLQPVWRPALHSSPSRNCPAMIDCFYRSTIIDCFCDVGWV